MAFFHCEVVPKEPSLVLKWACPPGVNTGFELGVRSDAWDNMTRLENCTSDNDTECRTEVTYLNFSTSYNISIATLSCGKMALPTQSTCTTGITGGPCGRELSTPGAAGPAACKCSPGVLLGCLHSLKVFLSADCLPHSAAIQLKTAA